jgi:uncharacterized membrane protein YphA (DoxX/SURF4 family)
MDRAEGGQMSRAFNPIQFLLFTARASFGALFLWASVGKIVDSDRFAQQVANYDIIGPHASALVGVVLPWLELIVGACLFIGIFKAGAWLGTVLMLACFVFARASVVHRGLLIECGCGVVDGTITARSVAMSGVLLLTALAAYLATINSPRRTRPSSPTKKDDRPASCDVEDHPQPAEISSCI